MTISLNEKEIRVLLDALLENIAFDNDADDIKELYNKVLSETNTEGYEKI